MQQCSSLLRKKKELLLIFHKICSFCFICMKTETQKIANLLNDSDKENGTLSMIKIMDNMTEEMKMMQPLNLIQKSLNQIFVITQMHMFL